MKKKARRAVEIEKSFTDSYQGFTYIKWEDLSFPEYENAIQELAGEKGWKFDAVLGKNTILRKLVDGMWSEEEFLVVPPGYQVVASYDKEIIKGGKIIERNSEMYRHDNMIKIINNAQNSCNKAKHLVQYIHEIFTKVRRQHNMKVYRTDEIRNVVLLGHGGSGKTSLVEAMAYVSEQSIVWVR